MRLTRWATTWGAAQESSRLLAASDWALELLRREEVDMVNFL